MHTKKLRQSLYTFEKKLRKSHSFQNMYNIPWSTNAPWRLKSFCRKSTKQTTSTVVWSSLLNVQISITPLDHFTTLFLICFMFEIYFSSTGCLGPWSFVIFFWHYPHEEENRKKYDHSEGWVGVWVWQKWTMFNSIQLKAKWKSESVTEWLTELRW